MNNAIGGSLLAQLAEYIQAGTRQRRSGAEVWRILGRPSRKTSSSMNGMPPWQAINHARHVHIRPNYVQSPCADARRALDPLAKNALRDYKNKVDLGLDEANPAYHFED
ncbi:hypothetical protein [Paraburkholderia sp. SIMBA_027]|uniref:hypothetical protein n=1 Tax=Paraburkholderia sp. SIMBA_027 TaxID=3085770 RepID=UPI0039794AD3